jgi:hypothetical protein
VISRCPISNLCLEFYIYIFQIFLINEYKSKSSGVWQECCGYGYYDMMQMKKFYPRLLWLSSPLWKKTKLNVQNNPCLATCLVGDIYVIVHSNFAFKSNMTTIGFDWDCEFGTTYAKMAPNGQTATCV